MNHYALAPLLLLDYAKNTSYNVFCSICSTSFSLVTDLQNHLSVHLHLDVELRGGLIHFDANLMSTSAYGNLNQNGEPVETGQIVGVGGQKDEFMSDEDGQSTTTTGTERIIEVGDGSNSYPGASENSDDVSTGLDYNHDETGTNSTDFNDDSYPNAVNSIKLDFSDHDDTTSTVHIKEELPVTPESACSVYPESTDKKLSISCDWNHSNQEPFVRNFECSTCNQKFVNLQSCLSHYSRGTCFQNGLEVVKVVEANNCNKTSGTSSPSASPVTPAYRCSSCDQKFSILEEFSVHCHGHSIHKKFAVDFHRNPKKMNAKPSSSRKKSSSTASKKTKSLKVIPESPKALQDPFKFSFKEPDVLLCHTCNVQYANAEACCEHLRNVNSKPLICALCGKLFKTEQVRDYHQKLPHVIPCNKCLIWFSDASSLSLHNRAYHRTHQEKEKLQAS